MSGIFEIADRYVDEIAALDPIAATSIGVPGHERELTDFSPDGAAGIAELQRRTLRQALGEGDGLPRADRIARDVMLERLGVALDLFEAGEQLRSVRILASPLQRARDVFDQMPKGTEEEWSNIAARLGQVPRALAGYRQTLDEGLRRGMAAAERQAREALAQAEIWSGQLAQKPSFFAMLGEGFEKWAAAKPTDGGAALPRKDAPAGRADGLRRDMDEGVRAAMRGYGEMARYFREDYLPRAGGQEAAGEERYQMLSRVFLGATIDLRETYQWGWEELRRVEREMEQTARKILPGASVQEAMALVESEPARAVEGVEAYREWLQGLHDEALRQLHGKHFDIPAPVRRIEVMIPPPGGSLAAYYTGPSEDFTRPGRTWWPTGSMTRFPRWADVSTVYHEGVPGHHLQVATVRVLKDELSRFQRVLTFVSGHGEGWALYAERLMGELGYLQLPDYYLGMLSAQALRCVRVIIDIGMHLELAIPRGERFHPGAVWDHDLALEFAVERSGRPREFMASELVRYLGWPAQAISYKVGERRWLAARQAARRRLGQAFDLKRFHTQALNLGPMGLEQLDRELAGSG
ncbi:MAG: DUF885 domain-containing protein [Dehalococcoidia bacterium]|nr:DUF885 domain-containing protein [Dehalococcoidia bacterium]